MTRILVQRGSNSSSSSSSNQSRSSSNQEREVIQESYVVNESTEQAEDVKDANSEKDVHENSGPSESVEEIVSSMNILEIEENEECSGNLWQESSDSEILENSNPPPPPPPPAPLVSNNLNFGSSRRAVLESGVLGRSGSASRRQWPVVSGRTSPSGASSPRSFVEGEGYNSSDEHGPCYRSSYDDSERERMFEIEIRRTKGLEVKRMLADGNCLFRAIADQVYGDPEEHELTRHLCIDYMERERDHFSQFVTEGFTSYCRRKRRDKVYGNNMEIQAFCEMYNRPIHIYSYGTEPINIFHGNYDTDTPPIRLSYHHGNHYNSLVDPRRGTVGAGLGFSSLRGTNVDKDQVKTAIKTQQDRMIDNALLAEGRFYSDLELTEKEMERMVLEASRLEYHQLGLTESSTSGAQSSSSGGTGTGTSQNASSPKGEKEKEPVNSVLTDDTLQTILSMGFSHYQVIEAYTMLGDDVDAIVDFLLDTNGIGASSPGTSRCKGKATE